MKISKIFTISLILLLAVGCQEPSGKSLKSSDKTEAPKIVKEKWHWDDPNQQSEAAGYAQVIKVGNTLYISGIPTYEISPEGITNLYNNLGRCLNAYGATFKDVVKETLYTTDIEAMKANNEVRKKFYGGDYPAATWVEISRLYEPAAQIEVDLIAEIHD